ncbi:amidohydrolase [Gottschalkiaceae bacterium SANA]|nr:amidohydrolase [Gottschalkiaceae bacterium SANA]
MKQILIENGKVITMSDQGILDGGQVLVVDGKIEAVGKNLQVSKDVQRIDAQGGIIMPGLIDAHCHVGIFETGIGFPGDDGNETSNPITPEIQAIDGVNFLDPEFERAARGGITTVATGPGSANPIAGQFMALKTAGKTYGDRIIKSPLAMKFAFGENPKNVYGKNGKAPVTRMATAALIREYLINARAYAKREAEGASQEFDLKLAALAKVIRGEMPVKAHCHRVDDILTALRIADEFQLDMSLEHGSEGYLIPQEMAKVNRPIILGPFLGFPHKPEAVNVHPKSAAILANAGVKIAIMTDLPAMHLETLPTVVGACMKEGLSEEDAYLSVTRNAAEILKLDDRIGSLQAGKDADIVIFNGHPFRDALSTCVMTMIDGEVIYSS